MYPTCSNTNTNHHISYVHCCSEGHITISYVQRDTSPPLYKNTRRAQSHHVAKKTVTVQIQSSHKGHRTLNSSCFYCFHTNYLALAHGLQPVVETGECTSQTTSCSSRIWSPNHLNLSLGCASLYKIPSFRVLAFQVNSITVLSRRKKNFRHQSLIINLLYALNPIQTVFCLHMKNIGRGSHVPKKNAAINQSWRDDRPKIRQKN